MASTPIGIGLIGCGTVGAGVVKLLREQSDVYAQRLGRPLEVRRILVRNRHAKRDPAIDPALLTDALDELLADRKIEIIVEVAGGVEPARGYLMRAIESGRHVVTANKALLAAHGGELFALARKHKVAIAFEASCGGTIPMLAALKFGLAANRIDALYGILNGTCNYILTQMSEAGWSYAQALQDAQEQGYAEADPTLDVTGADAAQKLAIVASLAFSAAVRAQDVTASGIDTLQAEDIAFGRELGYVVKLLAIGERRGSKVQGAKSTVKDPDPGRAGDLGPGSLDIGPGLLLRVQPCFVHADEPLAQVRGAFNALSVFGNACGHVMLYGRGAGQMPTASAVVGDILNIAGGWYPQAFANLRIWPDQQPAAVAADPAETLTRYYLRITAKDQPGVIAQISKVLGDENISISAMVQHESGEGADGFVPLVITTHRTREGDVARAAQAISRLEVARGRPMCIRIVDLPGD